ncbi:MAG: HAD family hydrolase [Clostridia bacterium]|nr:HAD family hydrolase [Clostridia bacterium]
MIYKYLVAADMDNTLIPPYSDITEKSMQAIKNLRSHGIAFTFATGRSHYMTGTYIDKLEIDVPIIACNGGTLYDPLSKNCIYSKEFTPTQVKNILGMCFASANFIDVTGYSSKGIYVRKESCRNDFFDNYNAKAKPEFKIPLFNLEPSVLSIPDSDFPCFTKLLIIDAPGSFTDIIKNNSEFEVVSSAAGFCDIMPAGQTKGEGLKRVAKHLNIPLENTFAFGDSDNDKSMLTAAGLGIAMENSTKDILEIADAVTLSCVDDGFAYGIDNIVLPRVLK